MTDQTGLVETSRTELVTLGPAEAFGGMVGVPVDLADGAMLPPLWHWLYALDRPAQAVLGFDGHPLQGPVVPPGPGLRRMFGGGRVRVLSGVRLGRPVTRRTRLVATAEKEGRSGKLYFRTVCNYLYQDDQCVVIDESDIIYRDASRRSPGAAGSHGGGRPSPRGRAAGWSLELSEVMLFRFSALTYNSHRIHYDREYARSEGYSDLVVHGPLQAMLMTEHIRRSHPLTPPGVFEFRLVAPLLLGQGIIVSSDGDGSIVRGQVTDRDGRLTAVGSWRAGGGCPGCQHSIYY